MSSPHYMNLSLSPGAAVWHRVLAISVFTLVAMTGTTSCAVKIDPMSKVSGALLEQVELRREQITTPDAERLEQMQDMGLLTENLTRQRIFVYVREPLSTAQAEDLITLGVNVHKDSWIPAVGDHPLGFFIAEIPVDILEELAARDYVVRLDTAERQALPVCPTISY